MHRYRSSTTTPRAGSHRLHALIIALAGLFAGAFLTFAGPAAAGQAFTICENQTYALCASAKCTVMNGVSYCKCEVRHGDSISLTQDYKKGDICSFNARGKTNGYMMSTFSTPPEVLKPKGDSAIYTCEADTSTGAYAQCDGGVCFQSTRGQRFPGFAQELTGKEIICSCPITVADPDTAKLGYQIVGPYPCQKDFFKYCKQKTANTDNGSTIYVGAPTGSANFLSKILDGKTRPFNRCFQNGSEWAQRP